MSTTEGVLPLGQSKHYWLGDFHFLNVLVRAYGKRSRLPFSTHFSQYCDHSQGTRTLRRMLEIVLAYGMESDRKDMQTVTAQDVKTFTEARDCLVYQARPFYLRAQLEAVIELLKEIRATMEAPEDAGNENIVDLEERLQATTVGVSEKDKSLIFDNGGATSKTDWDQELRAPKLHELIANGGRIDNDMFPYSPYTRQMKAQNWDVDLAFFGKKLQYKIDEPLPIESLYLFGSLPRPEDETVGIITVLFSYDFDEVRHRDSNLEKFLIFKEKLSNTEDFLERASLDTIIKILQFSQTNNPNIRRASLRNLYRNSWIINISRLCYFLAKRVLEHDEDNEPPKSADADLVRMIKVAQSFDIEEMDLASLPIRLKILEYVRIGFINHQIDHLLRPLDDLVDQMQKAIPRDVASTPLSGSWGYHKQGWTHDLFFFIGTLKERYRASMNHERCVRTVDGSNKLTDCAILDDDSSHMANILLSYDIEDVELDSLAPSLAALKRVKKQLGRMRHFCFKSDVKRVIRFLEQALKTKRLDVPAPGHEDGAWATDHSELLVLLGHRHRIWRDAALRELTDMAAFNKSLDAHTALVRGYSPEEMDATGLMLRLEDTKECVNMLDGVLIWYQTEEIENLVKTMQESEGYKVEEELDV